MVVKRGDVWLVKLDPILDSEQRGTRPCVIVSNDVINRFAPIVIAIPMTSRTEKKRLPTHVLVAQAKSRLKLDAVALTEHVQSVSKQRLLRRIAKLPAEVMAEMNHALRLAQDL